MKSSKIYKPRAERDENHQHIALKGVHLNKSPALSPTNTLTDELAENWGVDWQQKSKHINNNWPAMTV